MLVMVVMNVPNKKYQRHNEPRNCNFSNCWQCFLQIWPPSTIFIRMLYLWPRVVFMIIGLISHHMSSMIKRSISLAGSTADWSSGVWRRWSTRTGWPRMKISGSHRSGEFRNLGEFRKLSTCQVPQHREQGDNTGRLKVMDNNPKTWQLQDLPVYKVLLIFPKKRPRSAEFYFSLENMQHFEGSENKLTQTRTYNVNFICIYDLTWCPVFHTQSTSMVFLCLFII